MRNPARIGRQKHLKFIWILVAIMVLLPLFPSRNPIEAQDPNQTLIESDAPEVTMTGTWTPQTAPTASGGRYLYNTGAEDDVLTLQFYGPHLEVVYVAGPMLGTLAVEVDGTVLRTVITAADSTSYQERTIINYLTDEQHTLRVYSQEGRPIAVDAFIVVGDQSPAVANDTTNSNGTRFPCNPASPIRKISVREDGTAATLPSYRPSISADGRFVAFESDEALVTTDTNQMSDIYVADLQTCTMALASVSSTGTLGNGYSANAVISGDGRYVAFQSNASNLVASTVNTSTDIYVHDRQTGETTRVSVTSAGVEADGSSTQPRISDNGRYVLFQSYAANLGGSGFYIRDRQTNQTTPVPVPFAFSGIYAQELDLSGDGRRVFAILNDGLAVYDLATTQSWQLVPVNNSWEAGGLSSDGRYATFITSGPDFPEANQGGVYRVDLTTNEQTFVASIGNTSPDSASLNVGHHGVSSDGRFVLFETAARNILADADNADTVDQFLYDNQTGQTRRVSINAVGEMANYDSLGGALADNGQFVTFASRASNYSGEPNTNISNIYVINLALLHQPFDLTTQTLTENAIQLTWPDTATGETGWAIEESTNGTTGWTVVGNSAADVTQFTRDHLTCATRRYYRVRATWPDANRNDGFSMVARGITGACTVCDNTGYIYRVSVASGNFETDGLMATDDYYWWENSIAVSSDGRYTTFSARGATLVANDTNGVSDIFVHDNVTCQTTRVSVASDGTQANGYARLPEISANGRYVVFESAANNLVAGDTNNNQDVFWHDRTTGTTIRVSLTPDGQQFTSSSGEAVISGDGRYVAFNSDTTDYGLGQIYVWDSLTQQARLISASASGVAGDQRAVMPRFSADGRYLAFLSDSENLLPPDTPYSLDLYIADLQTNSLARVIAAELDPYYLEWWTASDYQLSADGRYVVYTFAWAHSVPSALEPPNAGPVYVLDRQTNQTTLVSVSTLGTEGTGSSVSISGDGRYVTFSSAMALSAQDTVANYADVYLHDRQTGFTAFITHNASGQPANYFSTRPRLSINGQTLAFVSYADNLVLEDTNVALDAFVVNIPQVTFPIEVAVTSQSQTVMNITWNDPYTNEVAYRIERSLDGVNDWTEIATLPANSTTYVDGSLLCHTRYYYRVRAELEGSYSIYSAIANARTDLCLVSCDSNATLHRVSIGSDGQQGNRASNWVNLSGDGRYVVFQSDATNLVPNDTNATPDIFVHDRVTCQTTRVSLNSADEQANATSRNPTVSVDGRYVLYSSYATNLVANDTDGIADIYLYDRQTRQVIQIYRGTASQDVYSGAEAKLSADGRNVVFDGQSSTLVSPSDTNTIRDVFVRELATGQTQMASRSLTGVSNTAPSSLGTISGDGRYVVFVSSSTRLVAGDTIANNEVFMRDMQTNTTRRISMSTSGGESNDSAIGAKISTDGRFVVYTSWASNIVPNDTNGAIDVFLYDVRNNSTTLVSVSDTEVQADASSANAWVSDDGRLVAFSSLARNLVANDTTHDYYHGFYVRDVWTGHTVRISQGPTGLPVADNVNDTALSHDGRVAAFAAYDSTLVSTDQNNATDVFVVNLTSYFTFLPAPTGLSITNSGLNNQSLTWTDSSPDETSYRLERSLNNYTGWTEIAALPADSMAATSTGLACGTPYYYRLRAYFADSGLYSDYSAVVSGTTAACPAGPTDVVVVNNGRTRQNVSWTDNAADETGYRVERSLNGSSGWAEMGVLAADSTGYTSSGLSCGTPYYYRVRAYYGATGIYSSYSTIVSISTPPCPDGPPDLTISTSTRTRHTLTWTDRDADATQYYVERSLTGTGSWSQIGSVGDNVNTYTAINLSCNTIYYFRVRAYYAADSLYSGYSTIISGTTLACPIAPTGLTITSNLVTQQTLVWVDATPDETAFYIERSLTGTGSWVQQGSVGANITTYDSTGLNCNTRYYYRVRAYFGDNLYSPYSALADATTLGGCPAAPRIQSMHFQSTSQITISWVDNADNETSYHVERSLSGSGPFVEIGSRGANTTAYTDTGLECGTTYYYRVRAYNANANAYSPYSNTADGPTWSCLILPTDVTAFSYAPDRITLTWTDNSVRETAYLIERAPTSTGSWVLIATLPVNSTSYVNTGLTCGTPYYYRLRTYDAGTNTYSNYAYINAPTLPCPVAPINFRVLFYSLTSVTLGWADNGVGAQGYSVEYAINGTGNWQVMFLTQPHATVQQVQRLACNTSYQFRVRAGYVENIFGPYSSIISQTTSACPVAPSNLTINFVSPTQLRLIWQDHSTNESNYLIERSLSSTGGWTQIQIAAPNTTTFADSWLACNLRYYYRVRAFYGGDALFSDYSNVATTLTSPCPPATLAIFYNSTNQASLLQSLTTSPAATDYLHFDLGFTFGTGGQMVMGDWNGDGIDTVGVYRNGAFFFTNDMGTATHWEGVWFGLGGQPVAGRFDASVNHDCLGVTDSGAWQNGDSYFALYFTCNLTSGPTPPLTFQWLSILLPTSAGFTGTHQFVAGDFDGDGVDSIAVRRGNFIAWTNVPPTTMLSAFPYAQYIGAPGVGDEGRVVAGDWDLNGVDSFGLVYQNGQFYRRNDVDWNSGAYILQQFSTLVGTPFTVSAWRLR